MLHRESRFVQSTNANLALEHELKAGQALCNTDPAQSGSIGAGPLLAYRCV